MLLNCELALKWKHRFQGELKNEHFGGATQHLICGQQIICF